MSVSLENIQHHNRRAIKAGNRGDLTLEQYQVAYEYFDGRCAYSGERMPIDSLEHIIALCSGGDTGMWNCCPISIDRNLSKNGYHLLDWYENEGKSDYSPYRLLKIVNYMMKVLQNSDIVERNNIEEMREAILLNQNDIDRVLSQHQDKIYSDKEENSIEELEELDEELELEDLSDDAIISKSKKGSKISIISFFDDIIQKIEKELPENEKFVLSELKEYIEEFAKDNFIENNQKVHNEILSILQQKNIQRRYGVCSRIVEEYKGKESIEATIDKRMLEIGNIVGKENVNKLIVKNPDVLLEEYNLNSITDIIEQLKNTEAFKRNGMELVITILYMGSGEEYQKKIQLLEDYGIKLDQSGMASFLAFGTAEEMEKKLELKEKYDIQVDQSGMTNFLAQGKAEEMEKKLELKEKYDIKLDQNGMANFLARGTSKKLQEHIDILQEYKRDDLIPNCKEIIKKNPSDVRRLFEIAERFNCVEKLTERMLLRKPEEIEEKMRYLIDNGLDIEDAGLAMASFCKKYGIDKEELKRKDVVASTKDMKMSELDEVKRELAKPEREVEVDKSEAR